MRVKFCTKKENGYRNYGVVAYTHKGRWFNLKVIAFAFGYKQIQFSFKIKK